MSPTKTTLLIIWLFVGLLLVPAPASAGDKAEIYKSPGPYEIQVSVTIDKDYFMLSKEGDPDGSAPDLLLMLRVGDKEVARSETITDAYQTTWTTALNWKPNQSIKLTVTDEDGFLTNTLLLSVEWPGTDTFPLSGMVDLTTHLGSAVGKSALSFKVLSAPGQ